MKTAMDRTRKENVVKSNLTAWITFLIVKQLGTIQLTPRHRASAPARREHCLGALNIYAAEADAFDADEVGLLSQLADDLAYGIRAFAIEPRDARRRRPCAGRRRRSQHLLDAGPTILYSLRFAEDGSRHPRR